MKQIALIVFSVFMLNSILVAEPTISSTSTSLEERYGDRIEIFGLKFKGPLVLCQVLIAILMMITFLQSSFDKIINRKENLEFFNSHFANSPLRGFTSLLLSIITVMEFIGGFMLVYGIYFVFVERTTLWIFYGFILVSLTLIALFTGQRLAKDYVGAADLIPYFTLVMLGIMSMY
ncbi:MAG: DoxX family protein [Fidelibacterota bacterium]